MRALLLPQSSQTALIAVTFHVSFGADMYVRGGLRGVFYLIWSREGGFRGVSRLGTSPGFVDGDGFCLFFENGFIIPALLTYLSLFDFF